MKATNNFKVGDTIKVIRMDDNNGKDIAARKMNGVVATTLMYFGFIHEKK